MISIVTPDTMRALEQTVMDGGVTEAELIERAAGEIATYLNNRVVPYGAGTRSVLAIAGPGNNGVDAIVAASLLASLGWRSSVRLVERENLSEHPDLEQFLENVEIIDALEAADVILDGIFGNSGRTDLPASATGILNELRAIQSSSESLVVAIDCPTGTNTLTGEIADSIVTADVTLCISNPKIGMLKAPAADHIGELVVLDIGVRSVEPDPDVSATMIDSAYVREHLPQRSPSAHKSQVGGLLVIGGAPGYYGAPRLAGEAALRSGCGYVGLAVPRSIVGAIASAVPELIYHPLSDSDGRNSAKVVGNALSEGSRYNAILCGPGLGRDEVAGRFLNELLGTAATPREEEPPESPFGIPRRTAPQETENKADLTSFPLVLDADALNWLSEQDDWPKLLADRTCVLTPHVGEMARLLGIEPEEVASDPWSTARKAASDWGQVVLLKNPVTCIATPDGQLFTAPRLTPELATPGTGDVLSGLVGAFLAQGCSTVEAAAIAVYVGSQAGSIARSRRGTRATIARDLIECLGQALKRFDSPAVSRLSAI